MSELELSLFRQRSQEALKQKASRGALILGVAAGYVKVGRDRIEKNPDQRVRGALQLVFSKFAEFQSAHQVHIWLRDEGIELPVKSRDGEAYGIVWRLPAYNIVHNILTNPVARRCCPHTGAPSRTYSTAAPRRSAVRSGAAMHAAPRCSLSTPVATQLPEVPHRPCGGWHNSRLPRPGRARHDLCG